jgi:hypothetical protein
MQVGQGGALAKQTIERLHQHLGDAIRSEDDKGALLRLGIKWNGNIHKALSGGDHSTRRRTQRLGQGTAGEGSAHAHQERVIEVTAQASKGIACCGGRDRETPRGAGNMRFFKQGVSGTHVVEVELRELHSVKHRASNHQLPKGLGWRIFLGYAAKA